MENRISNDYYRKRIIIELLNINTNFCEEKIEVDEETLIALYSKKLLNLEYLTASEEFNMLFNYMVSLGYIDTYKVLNYKEYTMSISEEEKKLLNKIKNISEFEDIIGMIHNDNALLEELLKYVLEFNRQTSLVKNLMVNKLEPYDLYMIKNNFPIIANDLDEYNYCKDVDINFLTDYYKKEVKSYEEVDVDGVKDIASFATSKMFELINYLKMLSGINKSLFDSIIEEIINYNYKWLKYIDLNRFSMKVVSEEDIQYQTSLYEDVEMELLIDETLYDCSYLNELIDTLLLIKCDNLFIDQKYVNDDVVNDFYEKNIKEEVEKRL